MRSAAFIAVEDLKNPRGTFQNVYWKR